MLTEALEQASENGNYPIMDAVMPAADGSVSLKTRVTDTPITPIQKAIDRRAPWTRKTLLLTIKACARKAGLLSIDRLDIPDTHEITVSIQAISRTLLPTSLTMPA